jgi:hypothetical protein
MMKMIFIEKIKKEIAKATPFGVSFFVEYAKIKQSTLYGVRN